MLEKGNINCNLLLFLNLSLGYDKTIKWDIVIPMPDRLNVLLVDDSPPDLMLAQEAFADYEDIATITTHESAEDALSSLQDINGRLPDVIITDLNMPGMNGFELIRAIKNDSRLKLIPVIFLSTSAQSKDIEEAYSLHASAYLVKANSFPEFVEQIEHFLKFWRSVKIHQQNQS